MNRTDARRWPRGMRLIVYTAAVVVTIILMTACLFGLVLLTGCKEAKSPSLCSDTAGILLPAVGLIVMAALGIPWVLFLARVLGIRAAEDSAPTAEFTSAREMPVSLASEHVRLVLGQHLVTGRVESVDAAGHRVAIQGLILRFWGGYALRNRQITAGEGAAFVYQTIPFAGLKYVLAFWKGSDYPVQSVGAVLHVCFLALGIGGMNLVLDQKNGHPTWLMSVCTALSVVSCVYLVLWFFAKRGLHGFISRGASS